MILQNYFSEIKQNIDERYNLEQEIHILPGFIRGIVFFCCSSMLLLCTPIVLCYKFKI